MIIQKEGKVIAKIISKDTEEVMAKVGEKLIEVEQELNGNVANAIYKKHGVALRFHL